MNGIDLAKIHVRKGTRSIIDDIDELRISLGFEAIDVTTPIVESRLRGGLQTNRPLGLNCNFPERGLSTLLTFQAGFPRVPLEVKVTFQHELESDLQSVADGIANLLIDDDTYTRAVNVVKEFLAIFDSHNFPIIEIIRTVPQITPPESTDEITGEIDEEEIIEDISPEEEAALQQAVLEECLRHQALLESLKDTTYNCRICRKQLFQFAELHTHTTTNYSNPLCTSYYLADAPVNVSLSSDKAPGQISGQTSEISGHLVCTCKAKVGNWSYLGNKCSCGEEWIAPAFQFVRSKVDVKTPVV